MVEVEAQVRLRSALDRLVRLVARRATAPRTMQCGTLFADAGLRASALAGILCPIGSTTGVLGACSV